MKIIDMHCDTISEIYAGKNKGEEISLKENHLMVNLEGLKKSGYSVQNFALFVDNRRKEGAFEKGKALVKVFKEEMKKYAEEISQIYTTADILKQEKKGKLSAMLTLEEGAVCEEDLEKLLYFYQQGVRMITLTWNYPNFIGYPNLHVDGAGGTPDRENGLTAKGIEFIQEMERLGIIVDVSHLSDAGFYDVVKYAKKPFVASHSNARALCPAVRNLTDDMIVKIAEHGGVIGVNLSIDFLNTSTKEASLADFARHIKHMVKTGGIEVVGFGSDFDGIPVHPDICGAKEMDKVFDVLKTYGFHESELEKIAYYNVFNVYKEVIG